MKTRSNKLAVREAVGVFLESDSLHKAVDDLTAAGFSVEQLGLLAGEHTVRQRLGDFYTWINESADKEGGPRTAFVTNNSVGDTFHSLVGSLFFVGTTVASGAAVASAAILGGALVAAIGGAVVLGGVAGAMALIINESDAEYLEKLLDEGHLLLFVRTDDPDLEKKALQILSKHGTYEARAYTAPATRNDAA
jgi:hypothetical protein